MGELSGQGTNGGKESINAIYIVRALAILAVIFVHVTSVPIGQIADKYSWMFFFFNFLNVFNKFGTPTFIFLSAFVLFYSYYDRPWNRLLIFRFFRRRFMYVLLPYFLCSTYYYVIQIYYSYGGKWRPFFEHASPSHFLQQVLTGKAFYHLYFVFISVQFYMLFPFLLWLFQRKPRITKHLVWIGLLLQWAFVLVNQYALHYAEKGYLAFSYLSFYFLGAYFGIYYPQIKHRLERGNKTVLWLSLWIVWLAASLSDVYMWYWTRVSGIPAHPLAYEGLWFLHAYTSAIVLLQLSERIYRTLKPSLVNALLHLGMVSFGVYIVHAAVLFYYFKLPASHQPILYCLYVAGGYVFTLLVSWGVVGWMQKYFNASWLLFGAHPKTAPYLQKGTHA